jgi:allantoinase
VVLIRHGKILDIVNDLPGDGFPVTDIGNDVLMPGIVDPHVHINEPGRTEWEGFETATRSAMAGGITTVVDMPLNSSPVTTTIMGFDEKFRSTFEFQDGAKHPTGTKLNVDCGFWGGIVPGNEKEIEPLIEKGILGFKAFLTHSGIDEFPNVTEDDLRKVMPIIAKHDLPLLVHCELSTPTSHSPLATRHYKDYLDSRPRSWGGQCDRLNDPSM